MSNSCNMVILVGNLGKEPELRHMPSNTDVCNFSLATNEVWKDNNGEQKKHTEWHNITAWGSKASACSKYLKKGSKVQIIGHIRSRSWEDKSGKTRYEKDVILDNVIFLDSTSQAQVNNKEE